MFAFLKKVVSSVLPWKSDHPPTEDLHEQEQRILECIKNLSAEQTSETENVLQELPLGQSDPLNFDVETIKCVHKSGLVTHLNDDYGLIDQVYYFELNQVLAGLTIRENDEVLYSAFKARDNEADRVYKVYALKNDSWEAGDGVRSACQSPSAVKEEEIPSLTRFITGRVTQRKERQVFIESANIWCNLDEIKADYVPVEGDWVEINAAVSVCEERSDLSGDVLVVKSLKPLLKKTGIGRVSFWSDTRKEGAIENIIYFTNFSCEEGFLPALGDEVTYDAVESDQDKFKWRAIKVNINNIKHQINAYDSDKRSDSDPFSNKNDISIVPAVCVVEVELNQDKIVKFEVTNNGTEKRVLKNAQFNVQKNSQLVLISPTTCRCLSISPKETILFQFRCTGKSLGLTGQVFFFHFKNFLIARRFEIKVVGNREMNKLLECKFGKCLKIFNDRKFMKSDVHADLVLCGPRPWKPAKFVSRERKCVFKIPQKLWNIVSSINNLKNIKPLLEYAPYLKLDLNFENYADWFHTLLYLEEIALRLQFRNYDMNGVFLQRSDDYFVLEVLGLLEKRPSLVVGDRIVLTQSWTDGGKIKHIGYIHGIQAKKIFVKFHDSFHRDYDESECDIVFEPNTNFFGRCHDALNRSIKTLGQYWLFPSAVNEKGCQIDFDIPEDSGTVASFVKQVSKDTSETETVLPSSWAREVESSMKQDLRPQRKDLVWVNQKLNERQRLAVVNVLRGQGRPLPYIIFGPPGTGKTATLVEIIIQIYRLMPYSRILISTPSNSSADLICERLIEFGNFKPGQLVRLLALYRVIERLVPPSLIPYSTFYSGTDGKSFRSNLSEADVRCNIKSSSFGKLAGRHRITVATCNTVGVLHYLGFPPGHFTHILIDEAGQTSEPEALLSASFQDVQNGQVILAGDPQQLGPVVHSPMARSFGLGVSLLQRLISVFPYAKDLIGFPNTSGLDPRFITKLNVNYRSVPEILSLPNQMFYNSDLIPTVSQTEGKEARIIQSFNFENRERPPAIIFDGVIGQNYQESDSPSWFNPHEIWQVVFYLKKLYSVGLKNDEIGIMSPYSKQITKLRNLLQSLDLSIPKIGSVEEFQGQERHVIILSTVRSSPKYLHHDIAQCMGFVASPQRLNVALTRARALLIIIGNPILLSKDPYWINVLKYCLKNNSYTGCSLDAVKDELEMESPTAESSDEDQSDEDC